MAVEPEKSEIPLIPSIDSLIPRKTGILPDEKSEYSISPRAENQLTAYVADLLSKPRGTRVGAIDFHDTHRPLLDRTALLEKLPKGISEQQFYDAIQLANLIECATETYGQVFEESAKRYKAPWLLVFNQRIWVPDELEHKDPFKLALLQAGYSEAEIDRRVHEVQRSIYEHTSGDSPVQMTMFGVIQEEITDVWHGLLANIFEETAPHLAEEIRAVKRRESLHKAWYRDHTATQIIDNPVLRRLASDTIGRFRFPGEVLVPDLFAGSVDLIPVMGRDFRTLERDLVRLISSSLVNKPAYLGEAIIDVLDKRSQDFGIPLTNLLKAVSRTPVLGHAVNYFVGLVIYQREEIKPKEGPVGAVETAVWNMTQPLRSLIVRSLDNRQFIS